MVARLFVHRGLVEHEGAPAESLGLVERDIGVLQEVDVVGILSPPHHHADAHALFDGDVEEVEGLFEGFEKPSRDALHGFDRRETLG